MSVTEKELVRLATRAYAEAEEPEVLAELATVFDATYAVLTAPDWPTPEIRWSHGGLQADSPFVEDSPSADIIWIATELVRALTREGEGRDLTAMLATAAEQLGDYTGQPRRTGGIAAALERMQAQLTELQRTVDRMADKLDLSEVDGGKPPDRRSEIAPPFPLPSEPSRSWTDKKEHKRLSGELADLRGAAFIRRALPLLRLIWPRNLAEIEEVGDAPYLVGKGEPESRLAVLPLSFEESDEHMDARAVSAAIEGFVATRLVAHSCLVIHNRTNRSKPFRHAAEAALAGLVEAGRVQHAELWDRQRLLRESFNAMLRHVLARLPRQGPEIATFAAFREDSRLALEIVPLRTSTLLIDQYQLKSARPASRQQADPATALLDRSETRLSVLIGEFGSGKTTAVARALSGESLRPIYVPGAKIARHVVGTKDLLQQCIPAEQLLTDLHEDDREVLEQVLRPIVAYMLKDPELPAVLIIDGLDESTFITRRGGFQHLFNILREVRVPVVLTMRSELWSSRKKEFAAAFGPIARHGERRNQRLQLIELLPWTAEEIRTLVRRYRERVADQRGKTRLDALAMLAETGRFEALYGDIPERPLFLRLILDSAVELGLPLHRIGRARLVYDWAERKILRDVSEPKRTGGDGRTPILSERESTVELAWEAMVAAAAVMTRKNEDESLLELEADCELTKAVESSPQLRRIGEAPLGLFLNSLLLPAAGPRGAPLRVRFAHRSFQEFFLAWFLTLHPDSYPEVERPPSVAAWAADIVSDGLLSGARPELPSVPSRRERFATSSGATPPDVEIHVFFESKDGASHLNFLLHAPRYGFRERRISGKRLQRPLVDYHAILLQKIERLHKEIGADGSSQLLKEEIEGDLEALGHHLYDELFPRQMRSAYRAFRDAETLLLVSEEPWIPWELVKPFDAGGEIDDDFLCGRFQLTRWLAEAPAPAAAIVVERLACVATKQGLTHAEEEQRWLRELVRRHPGIEDRSPPEATYGNLRARLDEGGIHLWHFAGHGRFDADDPDESGFHLADGRAFRALDLHGTIRERIRGARPLVFLNACQVARHAFSLTGLGGWAPRWVEDCACGAFVAPLWTVDDRLACAFAKSFYEALEDGQSFGRAAQTARRRVRELDPSSPGWLAFTVYAHPNGRVVLDRPDSEPPAYGG